MTQGGGQRREPRRFVPPPWERERFERLERERHAASPDEREDRPDPAEAVRAAIPAPSATGAPESGSVSEGPDSAQVDAMLAALRAEEPAGVRDAGKVALIVSGFVGVLGIMLVIWGMVALARSAGGGPAGIVGALVMSMMGGVLAALATWLGARGLKQRGERT
ncbi:MAG TPA: hypothetical protein VFH17_02340 [Coriobacteriia bacterium]|nr:hypothetical protein [Coriobacteriia bacterium]